jgi:hypothetical protein
LTARHGAFHLKAGYPVVAGIGEKGTTENRLHPPEPCPDSELLGALKEYLPDYDLDEEEEDGEE